MITQGQPLLVPSEAEDSATHIRWGLQVSVDDVVSENVPGAQGAHATFDVAVPSRKIRNCHQLRYSMERCASVLGELEPSGKNEGPEEFGLHLSPLTRTHTHLGGLSLTNSSDCVFLGHHLIFQ